MNVLYKTAKRFNKPKTKDYAKLAASVASMTVDSFHRTGIANVMCDILAKENKAFDRESFIKNCGL